MMDDDKIPQINNSSFWNWEIVIYGGKLFMKKFRTVASVIIMVIAGIVGFFIGAFLNEPMAGTILFSMIAGIACIVYAIDNHEE